jgi:hypothetical protein
MTNETIQQLLESSNNVQAQILEATRALKGKWEPTGLLEGLKSDQEQRGMAVMLENQARQLIDETTNVANANGAEQWNGVALPLVRRVFGEIAAKEFVSVQPMNLPSGLIFYLDYKYSTNQPGKPSYSGSSMFGGTGLAEDRTQTATGGLYDAGRFGYTLNESATAAIASPTNATSSWKEINFDADLSASVASGDIHKVTVPLSNMTRPDVEGIRAWEISGSGFSSAQSYYPRYTTVDATNVYFHVSGSTGVAVTAVVVDYHVQPTDSTRGDFEDTSDGTGTITDLDIPQVDMELRSETIVARTRKLKASWTPEMAQDLNAYHSIDAEAELTTLLSDHISREIDHEILDMLIKGAQTIEYWSAKVGYEYNSNTNLFEADSSVTAASAYQKNTWFATLGIKLHKVSNIIQRLTMKSGANFLVTSPDVATILESIPGFNVSTDGSAKQFAAGVEAVGSIRNRYQVYKNPYMTENVILMGYKGASFMETGAVYAPYVPLIQTPVVLDPTNFTPRKGVMTRYAKKLVRPEFYGKVYVGHMNEV